MNKSSICILSTIFVITVLGLFSSFPIALAAGNQISLEDLGMLQLAAHDFFNVDRGDRINAYTATDFENGKLDLSTLFIDMTTGTPFTKETVAIGGEPRNRENIILFSVATDLGTDYKNYIDNDGMSEAQARQLVLDDYHSRLNIAFLNAFGQIAPGPAYGCATMTENVALRTVHDFLPETILIDGNPIPTLSFLPPFSGGPLTPAQLAQPTSMLDGLFDTAFTEEIIINIPPNTVISIPSLLEADQTFGDQFNTDFSFDFFLTELADGSYDPGEYTMEHIKNLFAKGFGGGCYVGGESLPIDSITLMVGAVQSSVWLIPVVLSILGIAILVSSKSEKLL
jgi:hypothetical protein